MTTITVTAGALPRLPPRSTAASEPIGPSYVLVRRITVGDDRKAALAREMVRLNRRLRGESMMGPRDPRTN